MTAGGTGVADSGTAFQRCRAGCSTSGPNHRWVPSVIWLHRVTGASGGVVEEQAKREAVPGANDGHTVADW